MSNEDRTNWNTFRETQTQRVLDTVSRYVVLNADGQPHGPSFGSKFPALSMAETIGGSVVDRDSGEPVTA